jgi:hypothetical protein
MTRSDPSGASESRISLKAVCQPRAKRAKTA